MDCGALHAEHGLWLNSIGPTPTPTRTLGMRLSCNFVNVHTIAYHVQYTLHIAKLSLEWSGMTALE